jgi:group I intron endonuclease
MVENIINNNKYIGQSLREDIKTRWKYHKTPDSKRYIGQILYDAYKKYGIENFKYTIICICFDEDANKYEKEYICKYNTLYPNGYNLQSGGEDEW